MFFVYFTNFGYGADQAFLTAEAALEFAKNKGFAAVITDGPPAAMSKEDSIISKCKIMGYWSPIGGWRPTRF